MNCQNCKHWVFNKCMITGGYITADKLCNAWELSVSFDQVQKSNSALEIEKLDNVNTTGEFAEITFKDGRSIGFYLGKVSDGEWRLWDASRRFCVDLEDLHAIVNKLYELNG